MYLFKKHLESKGIVKSRVHSLSTAIDSLHSELCKLDNENIDIIKYHGIEDFLNDYSTIEQLKNPLK